MGMPPLNDIREEVAAMKPPTRMINLILLSVCLLSSQTYAQNPVPTHPADGEYIKEWLVLGPFFPNDLGMDFLASVDGEANVNPKEGNTITTADGKTLTWKRYASQTDVINLLDAVGKYEHAVAYAACVLVSPKDQPLEMILTHNDGVKV